MSIDHSNKKGSLTNARARKQAEEKDCYVLLANDNTLQIDIDNDDDFEFFKAQVKRLSEHVDFLPPTYKVLRSSGGNRHIIIELDEQRDAIERIMLQACLGSDRIREVLNYARLLNHDEEPVLLFRPRSGEGDYNPESGVEYVRDIMAITKAGDAQG